MKTLSAGTFSESLHPGLRLGFLVLPAGLLPAFAGAKALSDRHSPGDAQAVLARFITEGHLLRQLRRMRALYLQRQARLIHLVAEASRGALQLRPSEHGMHLCRETDLGADDAPLSCRAADLGVWLAPLSRYTVQARRRGWLFGYAGHDEAQLQAAVQRLAPLLQDCWLLVLMRD